MMKFISVIGRKIAILNKIYCSNFCIVAQWHNLKEAVFCICYEKTQSYTWSLLWTLSGGVKTGPKVRIQLVCVINKKSFLWVFS